MHYKSDGSEINVGDRVLLYGDVPGVVVCDFDRWLCMKGYEEWLTKEELVGGGHLDSGIMIETKEMGMLHYPDDDFDIARDPAQR